MDGLELALLVFGPVTVGVLVTLLRRMPALLYWSSLAVIVIAQLLTLRGRRLESGFLDVGPTFFAAAFLVVPTIATFAVARLIRVDRGAASAIPSTHRLPDG